MASITDSLTLLLVCLIMSFVGEGISWLLLYRKPAFKRQRKVIKNLVRQLDKSKAEIIGIRKQKVQDRKIKKLKTDIKAANQKLTMLKMKQMILSPVLQIVTFGLVSSSFGGVVMAKFPFEPIPLLTGLTHRGLVGEDFTECGFLGIFILGNIALRGTVQKALGFSPLRKTGPTMYELSEEEMEAR